ncbi:uncharacterized protein [Palaemon carinicauda]|uniref:uncharacterized protein isoform X1 n=1 Tax=Palaemon carinicauda TaxID=392227 RepID=UPI0035B5E23B
MATPSKQGVACCYCFDNLSSKQTLLRHKRRRHPNELINEGYEKPRNPLICRDCDFRCLHMKKLIEHYRLHNRRLKIGHVSFCEEEGFLQWKKDIEKKTKAHFVLHRGRRETQSTFVKNYYCNRSGFFISVGKGKRVRLKMSSKINYTCSAFLRVVHHKFTGKVEVEFCLDHTHESDHTKDKIAHLELLTDLDKVKTPVKIELVLPNESDLTKSENNCIPNVDTLPAMLKGQSSDNGVDPVFITNDCVKEQNCKVEYLSVVHEGKISDNVNLDICENQVTSSKNLHLPKDSFHICKCSASSTPFQSKLDASKSENVESTKCICQGNTVVIHENLNFCTRKKVKGKELANITHSLKSESTREKEVAENDAVSKSVALIKNSSIECTKSELLRMMSEIMDIITETSSSQTLNSLRNHIVSAHAVGKYLQSVGAKENRAFDNDSSGALNTWECLIQINKE